MIEVEEGITDLFKLIGSGRAVGRRMFGDGEKMFRIRALMAVGCLGAVQQGMAAAVNEERNGEGAARRSHSTEWVAEPLTEGMRRGREGAISSPANHSYLGSGAGSSGAIRHRQTGVAYQTGGSHRHE